jgi:hypothetical protein
MEQIPRAIEPVVRGHLKERRTWSYCCKGSLPSHKISNG